MSNEHRIIKLCETLGIAKSTYYSNINRVPSKRAIENQKYKEAIKAAWLKSKRRYGCIKIKKQLELKNIDISINRVWRLMNQLGIKSITMKKYKHHGSKQAPVDRKNILNQDFHADKPNQKWVTDITYIHTIRDGWTYLASVMDLYSKKIIGWCFGRKMNTALALQAVENALINQDHPKDVILHSDLGCQYTSGEFNRFSIANRLVQSFSRSGCPYDNACIESFHAILKREEIHHRTYSTYGEARIEIFDFIEGWYNNIRLHGSIDYMTPQQFEDLYHQKSQF